MKKVSVIVPVYNTEKYLKKCLDSLVNQTLKDIEVLVINDGSPDNSKEIIEEYEKKYPDIIKGICKENGGLSDARNYGLDIATGEYIGFVDSDDWVELDMFELLYSKAKIGNFDIVISDLYLIYEDGTPKSVINASLNKDIENKQEIKELMTYIYPTVWNKLYKRELLSNIRFKKGIWFEDVEFLLRLIPYVKNIGMVNKPLYNYLQRSNSITYTFNEKLHQLIDNMGGIIEYYKQQGIYEEYESELEYLYTRYAFATFMKRLAKCKDKNKYNEGYQYAVKKVNETFPNYKKNKYLKGSSKGSYIKHFNKFLAKINFAVQKNKKYN